MSGKQSKARRAKESREAAVASAKLARQLSGATFWHGGAPGLQIGEVLLTAQAAVVAGRVDTAHALQRGYADGTTDRRRVYFTTDREMARGYCGLYKVDAETSGALYRVQPIGAVEVDPDFEGRNVSWCAPGARILAVEEEQVDVDEFGAMERIGPYMAWKNGDPIYSPAGHFLPSPEMGQYGITAPWLAERYRRWTPWEFIDADLRSMLASGRRPAPVTSSP